MNTFTPTALDLTLMLHCVWLSDCDDVTPDSIWASRKTNMASFRLLPELDSSSFTGFLPHFNLWTSLGEGKQVHLVVVNRWPLVSTWNQHIPQYSASNPGQCSVYVKLQLLLPVQAQSRPFGVLIRVGQLSQNSEIPTSQYKRKAAQDNLLAWPDQLPTMQMTLTHTHTHTAWNSNPYSVPVPTKPFCYFVLFLCLLTPHFEVASWFHSAWFVPFVHLVNLISLLTLTQPAVVVPRGKLRFYFHTWGRRDAGEGATGISSFHNIKWNSTNTNGVI